MRRASSSRRATTISAAFDGVAARTSATKSAMVVSISWPTPETTGTGDAAMARATTSSLKAHRSSSEPPPRPTISTSTPGRRDTSRMARAISCAAPSPCTRHGRMSEPQAGVAGADDAQRCRAPPRPRARSRCRCVRGSSGSGRLRAAANRPSACEALLQLLEGELQRAEPARLEVLDDDLVSRRAPRRPRAAAREHVQTVGRLEAEQPQRRRGTSPP